MRQRRSRTSCDALEPRVLCKAGDPDITFDGDGLRTWAGNSPAQILTTADNKTVVLGNGLENASALLRFTADGQPDPSFGTGGVVTTPILRTAEAALFQSDGKLLVFGLGPANDVRSRVARFNVNGSLDTTFANNGFAPTGLGDYGTVQDVAFAPNGKIWVAGVHRTSGGNSPTLGIARLNADGSTDYTFDGDGVRSNVQNIGGYFSNPSGVTANFVQLVPLAGGKVVLSTQLTAGFFGSPTQFFFRLNDNGSADTSLMFTGVYRFDPTGGADLVNDVAPLADGSFVAVGERNGAPAAYKFNNLLGYEPSFNGTGWIDGAAAAGLPTETVVRDSAGRYVSMGNAGPKIKGARFSDAGVIDSSYETSTSFGYEYPLLLVSAAGTGGTILAGMLMQTATGPGIYGIARFTGAGTVTPPLDTGSISGGAFIDTNGNGAWDGGEAGLSNQTLFLDADDDGQIDTGEFTTTTQPSGAFTFANLPAGTHRVRRALPSGWEYTTPLANVTLTAGQTVPWVTLGTRQKPTPTGPPPTIASTVAEFETARVIRFTFSADVSASFSKDDLTLYRVEGSTQVALEPTTWSLAWTNTTPGTQVRIFPAASLPDGVYGVRVAANSVQTPAGVVNPAALQTASVVFLAGDANRDLKVDFDDLLILAQNYGRWEQNFSRGNFDYSTGGRVDFSDLLLLSQRYGTNWTGAIPALIADVVPSSTGADGVAERRKRAKSAAVSDALT